MRALLITANSITIEIINDDIYYTKEYELYLNGALYGRYNKNVISLYDLKPNTDYEIRALERILRFRTLDKKMVYIYPSEDDTKTIQEAIDNAREYEVLVLDGEFLVTNLFVKSNVSIYIPKNTTIYGELDRNKYTILKGSELLNGLPMGTWEGRCDDSFASIFTFLGVKNSVIYGMGVIDYRSGDSDWWINHRVMRVARRPKGIFIHTSSDIVLEGITVRNTPSWNQHAFYSNNISYYDMVLENPWNSPTTDGCDPEACDNVNIIGNLISVGDDCIAIKSSKIELAKIHKRACNNIVIRNNLMNKGHGGITLGSELSGGITNVYASKNYFNETDRGLRIKTQRGRGNTPISGIRFDNIYMNKVKSPFVINAFYKAGNDMLDDRFDMSFREVDSNTPILGEFIFEDIVCKDVSYGVSYLLGLPESMIKRVVFKNIDITYDKSADAGVMAMNTDSTKFKNIGFYLNNIEEVILDNVRFKDMPSERFIINNVHSIKEK